MFPIFWQIYFKVSNSQPTMALLQTPDIVLSLLRVNVVTNISRIEYLSSSVTQGSF